MADAAQIAALALVRQLEPALQKHDRTKQRDIVGQLIAIRAPMAEQWRALAHLMLGNGEIGLARKAIGLFVDAYSGDPLALYHKATVLEQAGALHEAYELVRDLPPNVPEPATHAFSLGTAALFLGEAEEAREQLELATRLRPQSGLAWLSLALAADLAHDEPVGDRIIAAERDVAAASPAERAAYFCSQGKVYAARGETTPAFAAFSRGASEARRILSYDRGHDRADAAESISGYSAARIAQIARRQTEPTDRSIFVTGLPRTGTTLVEHILAGHSAVSDGGEVDRLSLLMHEIRGKSFSAVDAFARTRGVAEAGKLWRHLIDERFPAPGRIVDKSLNTPRMIGLAAALLPEAPMIWLTRDPLDCAWSCFSNFFYGSMAWSYDLQDIAFHFRLEEELLRVWQEILGDRLLVVPHEELVTQPERWIRRILVHCRLDAEPQVFTPHENRRKVTTASAMQVRRPINRQGIGAAEPYRQFLQPFVAAYYG